MQSRISPTIILKREVPGLTGRSLAAFAAEASRAAKIHGAVTVLVTTNRQMRDLNLRFRGKPYATDVLSFPSPTFVEGFAGDLAVSLEIASQNARALGHSVADELRILVLHGILHLAGYDHESDNGEMAAREAGLRRRLGLPAALIERTVAKSVRSKTAVRFRR